MTARNAQALLNGWQRGNVLAAECPSRLILQHLTSRWGTLVMVALATGPHRFSELRRAVRGVSERMLSQTLKDLEADGFVRRTAHAVVPPHVDYALHSGGGACGGTGRLDRGHIARHPGGTPRRRLISAPDHASRRRFLQGPIEACGQGLPR